MRVFQNLEYLCPSVLVSEHNVKPNLGIQCNKLNTVFQRSFIFTLLVRLYVYVFTLQMTSRTFKIWSEGPLILTSGLRYTQDNDPIRKEKKKSWDTSVSPLSLYPFAHFSFLHPLHHYLLLTLLTLIVRASNISQTFSTARTWFSNLMVTIYNHGLL